MMKALIIGGTGNISTGITRYLLEQGNNEIWLFNRGNTSVEGTFALTGDRMNYADFEQKTAGLGDLDVVIDMICFEPDDARSDVRAFRGRTRQLIFAARSVFTLSLLSVILFGMRMRESHLSLFLTAIKMQSVRKYLGTQPHEEISR
jgi:NAD dependent epimerase/dehydratase family enzyme